MEELISYGAGIMTALSPCTSILIPLLFYTFQQHQQKSFIKLFVVFAITFVISYILLGYILAGLFTSVLRNGFKMGMGLLFFAIGVLNTLNRVNPTTFQIKSPWLVGFTFAGITSLSPCTIPYLGLLISSQTSSSKFRIIYHLAIFAFGLISPAMVFAWIGTSFLSIVKKKSSAIIHNINRLLSPLMSLSGIYLMFTTSSLGKIDLILVTFLLVLSFILIVTSFLWFDSFKHLLNPSRMILLVSLLLIVIAVFIHCSDHINLQFESDVPKTMDYNHIFDPSEKEEMCMASTHCFVCKRCTIILAVATSFGLIGSFIVDKIEKIKSK